ncbi:hypothetical protein [Citricoccus sp.]|uniref:hypothetical protein n=1 Tax=Citricoccus sp. TaxID=1978372 RepID=UPI00261F4209|nr:hypothetical protein [Citricoccus sp.]HRO30142.1 hypothetical protein [Citricoccus sp.]HRO94744.1 hypothetical protein [Citricoccus sp.]
MPAPDTPAPDTPAPGQELVLEDLDAVADLERYATRARTMADTGMRLQVVGPVLAAWVSVLQPRGLGDRVPVALGLRTFRLDRAGADGWDEVYPLSSVLERLARMTSTSRTALTLPPVTEAAPWTAVTPPRSGWSSVAAVADDELQQVAQDGIRELGAALPQDPGASMVAQARAAVWGRLLGGTSVEAGDGFLPAGAAFAAHGLGFLTPGGTTTVHTSGPWVRLSSPAGFVLCRQPMAL